MTRRVEDWSIEKLHKERTRIAFPEYQRQPRLWSTEKKRLLIDSILRDIDIPKLYFNRNEDKDFEVVDGQQRLWAIWDFLDDEYDYEASGRARRFSQLSLVEKNTIKNYKLQVTVLENANEEYLRQLFLRLQLGLLLITGEKLNAASGEMRDFVFGKLAKQRFIKNLGIPARRFAKETLCAQICINSYTREKLGAFARTRYEDILYFFQEYEHPKGKDRSLFEMRAQKILAVLDQMWTCFGPNAKNLRNRSFILSVYLFCEEMYIQNGELSQKEGVTFANFVFKLWKRLKDEGRAGFDRTNKELYIFESYLSSAPGEKYQIEHRHQKLAEYYDHFKKTGRIAGDQS